MPIVISLILNLIVIANAFIITYKLLRIPAFIDSLLSCFVLYFAQIILTELILGVLGILYLKNLLLVNFIILALFFVISRKGVSSFNASGIRESIRQLYTNKILFFGICVILVFSTVKIFVNLVNPPFGGDSLNYHFTFAVEWLKHGNLDTPITVFDDPSPTYYPISGSLYYLWLMLPFKNVFLADLGQIPFYALAIFAVYAIARKTGISKELSFYAAFLFLLIPNFFKQMQVAYVDVMVAALFLSSLYYLFLLSENFSWHNILIFSAGFGLLLGVKTVALPYAALLFLPFMYLILKNFRKAYYILLFIAIALLVGGFSYLRNFAETGNLLYPLDFFLFGENIFKGVMDKSVYAAHFKLEDYSLEKLLFHEGLGIQALLFVIPGIFLGLPAVFLKNKKRLNFIFLYFLLLPVLLYLVYRFVIPLANTRYLYPMLGCGIIIGVYTFKLLNVPDKAIRILVFICICASIGELAKSKELVFSAIASLAVFFSSPFLIKYARKKTFFRKPAFIVALLASIFFAVIFLEKDYVKNEFPKYAKMVKYSRFWPDATVAWDWLDRHTVGNNIAYAGRPVPFPLYGSNFKNNVYYVSVNTTEPAKLHYFPNSRYQWGYDFLSEHRNFEAAGNYRFAADYPAWLSNLAKRDIDCLFVYSLHQTKEVEFSVEDKWALSNPGKFIPVFANETIHIYKVVK